jgi:hypothetical protein
VTGVTGVTSPTVVSGEVDVSGSAGVISVHGDILGTGDYSGLFLIGYGVESFAVTGTLYGGAGVDSGSVFAGLDGSSGIAHVSIGGLAGGAGQSSGSLVSEGSLGTVAVTGVSGIVGGSGTSSGQIYSATAISSVAVKAGVMGGSGIGSGSIVSSSSFNATGDIQGNIGSVTIGGTVAGGSGANSGQVSIAGNANVVSIGGGVTGGTASGSGAILAGVELTTATGGNINLLKIGGTLSGGTIPDNTGTVTGSGYVEAGHIGSAVIGSITSGTAGAADTLSNDGAILAANDIASLTVTGSVTGTSASNPVVISAYGQVNPGKTDLAFGHITIGKNVTYTNFLAGYDQTLDPLNGAASIGAVVVGGNWAGSNLIAGAEPPLSGGGFGDSILITSGLIPKIASIIIEGHGAPAGQNGVVSAPVPAAMGTFGFVSGKIGDLILDGVTQRLTIGLIDDVGHSDDTVLRELS